jgi:hypothetical protein
MHGADGLGEAVEVALLVSDQLFASFQVLYVIQSRHRSDKVKTLLKISKADEFALLIWTGIFGSSSLLPDERRGARRTFPSLE